MTIKNLFKIEGLKPTEKLFILYLYAKGCHKKSLEIHTDELEEALNVSFASLARIKKELKNRGLIKVTRAHSNAVQEYELINPSDAK